MRTSHPKFARLLAAAHVLICVQAFAQAQVSPTPTNAAPRPIPAVTPRATYPATDARPYAGARFEESASTAPVPSQPTGGQGLVPDGNVVQPRSNGPQHIGSQPIGSRPVNSRSDGSPGGVEASLGNRLLASAVANISSHRSIAANIRHRISLFGHDLVGSGTYQQMDIGQDRLLRLELKIPLDDQITSVTQICDARFLWTLRTMPNDDGLEHTEISRIDLNRVRRAAGLESSSAGRIQDSASGGPSEAAIRTPSINGLLIGQGGLPQLLVELEEHFDFQQVHQATLQNVPVWMTTGNWKPEVRAMLFADEKDPPNKPKRLPAHVPEQVSVVLGREDLLPYQIEYRRRTNPDSNDSLEHLDVENTKPILTMELFRVEVGGAIDPNQFTFNATNRRVVDRTNDYLTQLRPAAAR